MRKYEACFSAEVGIGAAVSDLAKAGIKFQYDGQSIVLKFHMLLFSAKNEDEAIDIFKSGKPWRLLRFSTDGGPASNISLRDRGVEAPVETVPLKTYILIDLDECRVYMFAAEEEDDLPDMYYNMICEEDPEDPPSRKWYDEKFHRGTIKVECVTYYEKERQTVVMLFDW